jgi:hypothetical protein
MTARRACVLGLASSLLSVGLAAQPAQAQRLAVTDPAGDAAGAGLDITGTTLRNGDYAIRLRVAFTKATRGDLVVSIDRRHGHGLRLVSEYRPRGTTRSFVLGGAFTDKTGSGDRLRCPRFRVRWDADAGTAHLRLPSRCFAEDRYGAVRFAVLTERGSDTDWAPETRRGDIASSPWVPRG